MPLVTTFEATTSNQLIEPFALLAFRPAQKVRFFAVLPPRVYVSVRGTHPVHTVFNATVSRNKNATQPHQQMATTAAAERNWHRIMFFQSRCTFGM